MCGRALRAVHSIQEECARIEPTEPTQLSSFTAITFESVVAIPASGRNVCAARLFKVLNSSLSFTECATVAAQCRFDRTGDRQTSALARWILSIAFGLIEMRWSLTFPELSQFVWT